MPLEREHVSTGAYISNQGRLYRIAAVRSNLGRTRVLLEDAMAPLTTPPTHDPLVPGRVTPGRVVAPDTREVPLLDALRDFELQRHPPDPRDVATEGSW